MEPLEHGAIALLDALGIRGIWRGRDGATDTSALDTLGTVKSAVESMVKYCRDALVPAIQRSGFWEYDGIPARRQPVSPRLHGLEASYPRGTRPG